MAGMRRADSRDTIGMTRCRDPVAHGGANRTARMRTLRFGARWLAGDQKQHPVPPPNRVRQPAVKPVIGRRKAVPMQIDRAFGLDESA